MVKQRKTQSKIRKSTKTRTQKSNKTKSKTPQKPGKIQSLDSKTLFLIIGAIIIITIIWYSLKGETRIINPQEPESALSEQGLEAYNKGKAFFDEGNYEQALESFQNIDISEIRYYWSAVSFSAMGNKEDGIRFLEKAVDSAPKNYYILNSLSGEYIDNKQAARAIPELKKVIEANDSLLSAHYNLGAAYFMTFDLESTVKEFNKTMELMPPYDEMTTTQRVMLSKIIIVFGTNTISEKYMEYKALFEGQQKDPTSCPYVP